MMEIAPEQIRWPLRPNLTAFRSAPCPRDLVSVKAPDLQTSPGFFLEFHTETLISYVYIYYYIYII
jgi:hypothetical protein